MDENKNGQEQLKEQLQEVEQVQPKAQPEEQPKEQPQEQKPDNNGKKRRKIKVMDVVTFIGLGVIAVCVLLIGLLIYGVI